MSLSENIKIARLNKHMTQGELAQGLNKSKNVISNWERGDNKPDAESILQLCTLLDLEPNSLLDWKKEKKVQKKKLHLSYAEENLIEKYRSIPLWQQKTIDTVLNDFAEHCKSENSEWTATRFVPIYAISPSAGYGNYLDSEMDISTIEISDTPENRDVDFILKVDGHSMEPKYKDGCYVKVKKQNEVQYHEIGIFIVDGTSFIKQYELDHLHSINKNYADIQLYEEMDVRCVGKVIGEFII